MSVYGCSSLGVVIFVSFLVTPTAALAFMSTEIPKDTEYVVQS